MRNAIGMEEEFNKIVTMRKIAYIVVVAFVLCGLQNCMFPGKVRINNCSDDTVKIIMNYKEPFMLSYLPVTDTSGVKSLPDDFRMEHIFKTPPKLTYGDGIHVEDAVAVGRLICRARQVIIEVFPHSSLPMGWNWGLHNTVWYGFHTDSMLENMILVRGTDTTIYSGKENMRKLAWTIRVGLDIVQDDERGELVVNL